MRGNEVTKDLPNYGFIQSRLNKKLHAALLKECLNKKNKKTMLSGITNPGVAPHFWLNNNELFVSIQNTINKMLIVFKEKYPGYVDNIKILSENRPLVFHQPWINYHNLMNISLYMDTRGCLVIIYMLSCLKNLYLSFIICQPLEPI